MTRLDVLARTVRAAPIPARARTTLWRVIARQHPGQPFLFPIQWRGRQGLCGGVCGASDHAVSLDLSAYEPESVAAVEPVLRAHTRPLVIDAGAHTGAWIFIVKALAHDAVIHAFEPFPALAAFLTKLVARNGWPDVHVNAALLGAEPGEGELHFAGGATDCASTVADFQPGFSQSVRVPRLTLDDYVERQRIDAIALI